MRSGSPRPLGFAPSLAIYEPGFLQTVLTWYRAGRLPKGTMAKLYFGGEWGLTARGRGVTFGLLQTPVARLALELGGHLHVGIEEHFDPRRTPTNLELLEQAKALCASVGRPLATTAQTIQILGLPVRSTSAPHLDAAAHRNRQGGPARHATGRL